MGRKGAALVQPIRQQIVKAVEAGVWMPGTKLPSTREMAREMGVDPRDISSAYRALAAEGLVELRPRSGAYVSGVAGKGAAPPGLGEGWIADVLADAVSREIPATELGDWMSRSIATLRMHAFVIAPSADQLAGLRNELSTYYGLEVDGATEADVALPGAIPPALRRADFVICTEACRSTAERVSTEAGIRSLCVSVRPDLMSDTWRRLLKRGMIYVVMRDWKFEGVLAGFLATAGGGAMLKQMVVGRDDLSTIPDDAIVYITQAARAELGDTKVKGLVLPPARVLSQEVSREILGLMVKENLAALRGRHTEKD